MFFGWRRQGRTVDAAFPLPVQGKRYRDGDVAQVPSSDIVGLQRIQRRTSAQRRVPGTPSGQNVSGSSQRTNLQMFKHVRTAKTRQVKVSANESRSAVHLFPAPWCFSSSFIRARVRRMFGFASSRSHVKVFLFGTWTRKQSATSKLL